MKDEKILNIFCGDHNSFLIMKDNSLYGCGNNHAGQLGIKGVKNMFKFEFVMGEVKQVFTQYQTTTVLKKNDKFSFLESSIAINFQEKKETFKGNFKSENQSLFFWIMILSKGSGHSRVIKSLMKNFKRVFSVSFFA